MNPTPGITVRDAADGDMAAVQTIYAYHVRHGLGTFEEVAPKLAEMHRRREALISAGFPYLVAECDTRILGFAYAGPYQPRSAYRFTVEDTVYVAGEAHRQGVGLALMHALIARCETLGARQMVAVIGDSGNVGSIGLHARVAFVRTGLLPAVGFKHGRWVDVVLMQRPLGPGDTRLP